MSRVLEYPVGHSGETFVLKESLAKIEYGSGEPPRVQTTSGDMAASVCLRCRRPPCQFYDDQELASPIAEYPTDERDDVCPTGAIEIDSDTGVPTVDSESCLGCGLCVARCPVGAMYLTEDGIAEIASEPNKLVERATDGTSALAPGAQMEALRIGAIASDRSSKTLLSRISSTSGGSRDRTLDLLARNLLIQAGTQAALRRRGDTNVRMDMAIGTDLSVGTAELELAEEMGLDGPRNLLDNIAVLCARYGFEVETTLALTVARALPPRRADYWNVIDDVHKVLGVQLKIVTLGALALLCWNWKTFNPRDGYRGLPHHSIQSDVERDLGRPVDREVVAALKSRK